MHKVCVSGYRKYLHTTWLEFLIVIGNITELSRADKRKIRGIENEHCPFALDVLLADLDEFAIFESLRRERLYLRIDQRHNAVLLVDGV